MTIPDDDSSQQSSGTDLFQQITDYFEQNYTGLIPVNQALTHVTRTYLATLDPADPPAPKKVEQRLLTYVNGVFTRDNEGRPAGNKTPLLRHLTTWQIAQCLLRLHRVVTVATSDLDHDREYDLLAMYVDHGRNEGIYTTSEDDIRTVARDYHVGLSINDFREVVAILRDDARRVTVNSDRDMIAVNNGVFDYKNKVLLPFTPDLIFLSKCRVDYNPDAESPVITNPDGTTWEIEEWMRSLSDDDGVPELLWQINGAIIRPHVRWGKSAWFYSEEGNNGKGTLCELMRNLAGPGSFTSIPISEFGKDFALEPLLRAQAIITDENDVGTFVDKAANLKAIVTNDVIEVNRKYRMPVAYQFWGFMVQCLNELPRFKDKSDSLYRRQLFVPFTKCFTGSERKYIKDDYLHRRDVLEYVLKRVLHMDYYQLDEPVATKQVMADFQENNDPVRQWFMEFRERLVWDLVPFTFCYDLFKLWFADNCPSGSPVSRNVFIKDLLAIVRKDPDWFCSDKNKSIRPGNRMSAPEPLIAEYGLKNWMDPLYRGTDPDKLCRPRLAVSYRGIQRIVPLAAASDDDEADDDTQDDEPTDDDE